MKTRLIVSLSFMMFLLVAFISQLNASNFVGTTHHQPGIIHGLVQIGPFQAGSSVEMTELRPQLLPIQRTYNTFMREDSWGFTIPAHSRISDFVKIKASGHYFDLTNNTITDSPITLYAISDLNAVSVVNVNVLTDLERPRVEHLVREEGLSIQEAKQKAQSEILNIFGIAYENMPPSETLDIKGNSEADAILLAVTLILQSDYTAFELERLLETIGEDIRETGELSSDELIREIWKFASKINLRRVSRNIFRAYGVSMVQVSFADVEKHINAFLDNYSSAPTVQTIQADAVDETSIVLNAMVNPNGALTTMFFEYHTKGGEHTTVYADQSPVQGHSDIHASASIYDILPTTMYYYRAIAFNVNDTVYGRQFSVISLGERKRRFIVGYHAGVLSMSHSLTTSQNYNELGFERITAKPGFGFQIGLLITYRLTHSLSIMSRPSMSFYENTVEFHPTGDLSAYGVSKQTTEYVPIKFPLSLRYAFLKDMNTRPFIVAGLEYLYDLNSSEGKNPTPEIPLFFRTKKYHASAEFGIGVKRKLKRINLSAEVKTVMGLNNIILPGEDYSWGGMEPGSNYQAIDQLRSRGIIFSLIIE